MRYTLPMMDISARWTGPLACVDDDAAVRHGDDWPDVVARYAETGDPCDMTEDGLMVTLRPLSAAEEDVCEAEAGPPVPAAAYIYGRMSRDGVSLDDAEAVARAVCRLDAEDRSALHEHERRVTRLRAARVSRALVAAGFAGEGEDPGAALMRIVPAMRAHVLVELAAHLDRLTVLGDVGKAPAGGP